MKLILNSEPQRNHRTALMDYGSKADELLILSPFLAYDVGRILSDPALQQLSRFRLITTLEPHSPLQIGTATALNAILRHFGASPGVTWSVDLMDGLHGKVYLFSRGGAAFAAIVSSANFTASGLESNQEWGIASEEEHFLAELKASIDERVVRKLSPAEIVALYRRAKAYLKRAQKPALKIGLNLLDTLGPAMPVIHRSTRVWLKPSGSSEDPVRPGDDRLAHPVVELDFSRKRPSGVGISDLVIVYGVGDRRVMGLYEVTGTPVMATEAEVQANSWKARWPWHVTALNRALAYSKAWSSVDLPIRGLVDAYHSTCPNYPITSAGSPGLGTLNRGNDKVRLHPDFARFVVERLWAAQQGMITSGKPTSPSR